MHQVHVILLKVAIGIILLICVISIAAAVKTTAWLM